MRYKWHCLLVYVSLVLLSSGCVTSTNETEAIRTYSVYKQKTLDELGPFAFERRLYVYQTMDALASQLAKSGKGSLLKKERTKASGGFFEKFPILELVDKDLDGKADQFCYLPIKGGYSAEWGIVFDQNHDGKIDYLVFNGGPLGLITKDKKLERMVWQNYHWIDSNYDGKVDIFVYSNNIDLDGDKSLDEGVSGWVYDTDFDGLIDRAEYLGDGFQQPAEKKEGYFIIKTVFGEKKWGSERAFGECDVMLFDINSITL